MDQDADKFNPLDEEKLAIERIGGTYDGRLLHRYLRRVLESVIDIPVDGALRTHNGRRSLARDLMSLMAQGIEGNSGRSDTDTPILKPPGPAASHRRPAGSRRVDPDPAVAAFLREHGADET